VTVMVNSYQLVRVPLGTPLATVTDSGDVSIWPGGVGTGPCMTMTVRDWEQIKQSADAAIRVARIEAQP
jgi:hypothetical protein